MGNKYSKWNLAKTYREKEVISIFSGQDICYFQHNITKVYLIEGYVRFSHTPLDDIDYEILARLIGSRVIVMEQLYCYLYIQGIDVSMQELEQRMQMLHSRGLVKKGIIINGKRKTFINHVYYENMEFYIPAEAGVRSFEKRYSQKPYIKKYKKDWTGITWYEYIRSGIMWNQIILKLLIENKNVNNFNIQFAYSKNRDENKNYVPLLINTTTNAYVFEFVRGLEKGKEAIVTKWQQWVKCNKIYAKKINLVFLCENLYHMEMMAMFFKRMTYESPIQIYFTHDEWWFGLEKGKIKRLDLSEGRLVSGRFI